MYHKALLSLFISIIALTNGWSQKVFFSGNDANSVFLCEEGRIFLSGENNTGQLGRGNLVPSNIPVEISGIDSTQPAPSCKQVQIKGVATFLALTQSGDTILAWGPNQYGQCGDGTTVMKTKPVIVKGVGGVGRARNIIQIATGNYTGYALNEDGKILSWGINNFGQVGAGNLNLTFVFPTYVLKGPRDTLKNVKAISAGGSYAMALLCDGTVWAWGRNNFGQLGQNNNINSAYALPVRNSSGTTILQDIIKIEAADNYAYALSSKDTLWTWGPNWDGRLGTGTITDYFLPTYVRNSQGTGRLSGVTDIAAGQGHSIALMTDKTLYAWGANKLGQLGVNDTLFRRLPTQVMNTTRSGTLMKINHVSTGDDFSIARSEDNRIFVWGGNTLGQLGVNDHVHRWLPVELNLPCKPTRDTLPGNGKMKFRPTSCIVDNSGSIFINKHHNKVVRWEQSTDNFNSSLPISNTNFSQSYSNLGSTTQFRVVLRECGINFFSPVATITLDSVTRPGKIKSSASVRININRDTLRLTDYKGSVVRWEFSDDNFISDKQLIQTTLPSTIYSNLTSPRYYRVLVKSGDCPALYSDTAEIHTIDEKSVTIFNGFTPDNDGYNDEWVIENIDLFPRNNVEIYNRWGQLVFRAKPYSNDRNIWKGVNNVTNSQPAADGTYFYLIDLGEGSPPLKGFVVLTRGDINE